MSTYRSFALCLLFFAVFVLSAASPVFAAKNLYQRDVYIRENNTNYYVEVKLFDQNGDPLPTHTRYDNDEDCGDSSHRTRYGANGTTPGRFFQHDHVHCDFSNAVGTQRCEFGSAVAYNVPVTAAKVQAYWDHYYFSKYNSSTNSYAYGWGGEDMKVNCFGYALGYDTWILSEGIDLFVAHDYVPFSPSPTVWAPSDSICIQEQFYVHTLSIVPGHVLKVWDSQVDSTGSFYIASTYEKNWESGIYCVVYSSYPPRKQPEGDFYKKKP